MIGHGIGPVSIFRILHLQVPHTKIIPGITVLIFDVDIGLKVHLDLWNIDLDITTRLKIKALPLWELNNKLLDKRCYILIRDHFTLPLLDFQHLIGYTNLNVFTDLHLATKPPIILLLFAGKKSCFSRKNGATSLQNLAFTHGTCPPTPTSRRQKNIIGGKCT